MKPYQPHLFKISDESTKFISAEPVFVYDNKRYINFSLFDFRNLRNNEYLKETARHAFDTTGLASSLNDSESMESFKKKMSELKKIESLIFFPDEVSAIFALISIFEPRTVFFIDYETSPSISAVLRFRNVEYYHHENLEQLAKLLTVHSEKAIIIDGLYEWLGYFGPINEMVKLAKESGTLIIANELNSFGLLGRDGRGFVDLFYLYDDVGIEIGSFDKFIGGFGTYLGAKKYLINKIMENINGIYKPLPEFMVETNLASLNLIMNERANKVAFQKLWTHSRYFINRLKQVGLKTKSETPIIVVIFNNNDEAEEFSKQLFKEGIIVQRQRERIRFTISIEHTEADLDYTLDKIETLVKDMGITF